MTTANYQWHDFEDRQLLAQELAQTIAEQLNTGINQNGLAVLALSGGSTPKLLFQALTKCQLDWRSVVITLVDERCVDQQHELSNAKFLRQYLLDSLPAEAPFVPMYYSKLSAGMSLSETVLSAYCDATNSSITKLKQFDVVVLGMGEDGHTASFFPDADNIQQLVDPHTRALLLECESKSSAVARLTWSLPMLLSTRLLILHITGVKKRKVFDQALLSDNAISLPIRATLHQQKTKMHVYYAD